MNKKKPGSLIEKWTNRQFTEKKFQLCKESQTH